MSYFGLVQADLENRLNAAVVLALFDDGTGLVNTTALAACIDDGEQEMMSWLVNENQSFASAPVDLAADPFYKTCALDFAIAFAIERHPEAAKQAGLGTKESYFARASARAERVQAGRQRATDMAEPPANVGGPVFDGSPRMYIPNSSIGANPGQSNAGDF